MTTATKEAPKAETKVKDAPLTAVRRHKGNEGWVQADRRRWYFKNGGDFKSGILTNVVFVHEAPPMQCIEGYDSTGEAIGTLEIVESPNPKMPKDIKRALAITYDPERRRFHSKIEPKNIIFHADCLILDADGTATAGWKN